MLNNNQRIFLNSAINLDVHIIDYDMDDFEDFYWCSKEEMKEDIKKIIDLLNL